jgi:hypothetical protein
MLVQDSQTGYFHEAPDYNVAGYGGYEGYAGHAGHGGYGQVLYDGLGNPVGMLGPIFDMARKVVSNIPIVGGLVNRLIPGSAPPPPAPFPTPQLPFPAPQFPPSLSSMVSSALPGGSPFPGAAPAPWPYGWVRPQGPLMAGNRRLYLRCTAWPGPQGLAPSDANMPGLLPPTPGAPMPGVPAPPVYHRRRHRRRR